jgi:phenylalanyl-tRNA synthetase beta chain
MKFSEAWLRQWVNPELERDALLQQLTMAGLEVDGVEAAAKQFSGVVVGRIETAEQHPDADKLRVCQVSDGNETFQVVCGAPNARQGLLTAFAKVGAVLPDNFKIKKAKLRGVESFGMLCSADELGLGDDHSGIMELGANLSVGGDLAAVFSAELPMDDITVDLDLTPNRGDCLSIKGLAREVGVLNNAAVSYPVIEPVADQSERVFPITVDAKVQCPRYLGRVIEGVDLSRPTPLWMSERLRRCGLRSIDPVVDVTNYVLIEQGQPMHAFDLSRLDQRIQVRMAKADDKLTLLDGQDVALDAETLVIADDSGPVAIAGVMGGKHSGVQNDTQDLLLECAFFAPLAIAGTARRYGLHTDASHRYERGVDAELQAAALQRATQLLLDIVGGVPGPIVEAVSKEDLPAATQVTLRQSRLQRALGVEIDAEAVDEAMARLDFVVHAREETAAGVEWQVLPPSHRFDIALEADLIEEVCRIYGYNNIPSTAPVARPGLAEVPLAEHSEVQLRQQLVRLGFNEVITYSFIDPEWQQAFDPSHKALELMNPMSSEQSVMRTTMLPGLVQVAKNNSLRQQTSGRAFEVGLVFVPEQDELVQRSMIAGVLWGDREAEGWYQTNSPIDFFDAKGVVEALCEWTGQPATFRSLDDTAFHPGQSAEVVINDHVVGRVGLLHPLLQKQFDAPPAFVFELMSDAMLAKAPRRHQSISKFPQVRRDLAVVVQHDVPAAAVLQSVRNAVGEDLVDVRLFDVYVGEGIDSNEKSLAIGLTLQSQTTTLSEEEINALADSALQAMRTDHAARQR